MTITETTAEVLKRRLHTVRALSGRSLSVEQISEYSKLMAAIACVLETADALDYEDQMAIDAQVNQLISRIPTPENIRASRYTRLITDALDTLLVSCF